MSKQKILTVEPLIQCEAGRAKTKPLFHMDSKMAANDKGELALS